MVGEESLTGWGGSDPDDLAAVVCASLRLAGHTPMVSLVMHCFYVTEIRVYKLAGERNPGTLVATFPMHPVEMSAELAMTLARAIEHLGNLGGGVLNRESAKQPRPRS